jgi:ABC-type lipoprotein export system ATPase subunit
VVIVTHDPRVLQFADRMVKIEDGAIAQAKPEPEAIPAGVLLHNMTQVSASIA